MLKYRPDIDGLRAIAVGSVVLYHLDESLLSGGFVGVDVFFVISGYLITKLIYKELSETGTFSFGGFYLRRVRRLFPALFVTLLLSLIAAYKLSAPPHLVEFGQSLIAAIFSVSNFYFWSIAGYFDSDSTLKPLLHTWSLSVEEQFYLLWPAILVGLYSLKRGWLFPAFVIAGGIASLLLNQVVFTEREMITSWFGSEDNQSALDINSTAFYLLPFRVYEFAIGAILVWMGTLSIDNSKLKGWVNELCFVSGLLMVVYAVVTFDSKMDFPSTAALIPCVGAALMIYSGPSHRLVWLVSNRVMVGVGLISYSLYLVHWPLIVFYKYWSGQPVDLTSASVLLVASVILAYLMYRFVEQPYRKPRPKTEGKSPNRKFLLGALVSTLTVITVSANAAMSGGWLWRYPPDVVAQLKYKYGDYTEFFWANIRRLNKDGFQDNQKPKVLVIGDSMAADLLNVLVAGESEQEIDLAAILVGENCRGIFPLTDTQYQVIYGGAEGICRKEHNKIMARQDLLANADTIILASYWWEIPHLKYVESTVQYLKSVSDARIKVLGIKEQQSNGISFLRKHAFSPQISKIKTPPHPKTGAVNKILRTNADDYDYFDLLNLFCDRQGCQRVTEEGYVIIFDGSHLSENGALFLARNVKQKAWYQAFFSK